MGETTRSTTTTEAAEPDRTCPVAFCPVGMFLTATGSARPEAVDHLVAAGRELMLALSGVVGSRVEDLGRRSPLEKIDLE